MFAFDEVGKKLADFHVGYEHGERMPASQTTG